MLYILSLVLFLKLYMRTSPHLIACIQQHVTSLSCPSPPALKAGIRVNVGLCGLSVHLCPPPPPLLDTTKPCATS